MAQKESKITLIPLGGLGEIGNNMTVVRYGNSMVVIDCGMEFPEDDMLGIDTVIPDYTFLLENKKRIKGIFLTHGHEDHIGALPYVLKELDVPVYGTRLTLGIVKHKLKEARVNANLVEMSAGETLAVSPFKVEFIRMNHSIPDGGWCCNGSAPYCRVGAKRDIADDGGQHECGTSRFYKIGKTCRQHL